MTTVINYELRDNIAIITLNNPPVNGLGLALRQGITNSFEQAISDSKVEAIILDSASKIFCGGADINEFGSDKAYASPTLPEVCNLLEESSKPIIGSLCCSYFSITQWGRLRHRVYILI